MLLCPSLEHDKHYSRRALQTYLIAMSTRFLPSKSILEHFRQLPSNNAEERVTAATAIVIETSEPGADHAQTVQYVLARLTKGLASGSDSSRLGFGIAYAEVRGER